MDVAQTASAGETALTYERDGFAFPFQACTRAQAADIRADMEEVERVVAACSEEVKTLYAAYPNMVTPWVDEIAHNPQVVEAVKAVLGPNVLLWNCSIFIKEPRTSDYVGWHQDLHYWGLSGSSEVTAWVAITPATVENGCMRFVAGSHLKTVRHVDTDDETNMLSRNQELAVEVDEADATEVVLEAGAFSLHHGNLFHASHPNRSDDRRIGLALRYITPDMSQTDAVRDYATLVAGEDPRGRFELLERPRGLFHTDDLAKAREVYEAQYGIFFQAVEDVA
ncbi:MAG: phytanoyl-CoA dioxygenase family protein [Pseudomonadota bacterium]